MTTFAKGYTYFLNPMNLEKEGSVRSTNCNIKFKIPA